MRILLTALHPPGGRLKFGGVQSWIDTVARALYERGHEVVIWGPEWALPEGRFDLGILAHTKHTKQAVEICDRAICVTHGIVKDEEPSLDLPTVFTSEEIRYHWRRLGPIVRQPIDLTFWRPSRFGSSKGLVFFSYRAPTPLDLNQVAKSLGMAFLWLRKSPPEDVRDILQRAEVVVASGRASLEAMACGIPTVIADFRPYLGKPLFCDDMILARRNNYSGRGGVLADGVTLLDAVARKRYTSGARQYVESHHDAERIVDRLLEVAGC